MSEPAGPQYGVLRGRHVLLRAVEKADAVQFDAWSSDPDVWPLVSGEPWLPQSVAQSEASYDQPGGRWSVGPVSVPFAVEAEGALAGHVALFAIDQLSRSGRFGITLGPHARGRGWGSDATRVLLRYAFLERGLHRVSLDVLASNTAAVRTYEAAGFRTEGTRRESAWVAGRFVDMLFMAVLATDDLPWLAVPAPGVPGDTWPPAAPR